ncbi:MULTISPECIES: capsule biosynthesis protein [Sinorhizobium]|uniref:Capsular biosynthesis protein n=2 Tax=Sinorhizobium TaxID=28105 RepID=A0A2S3YLD8_9HYPH|nr:MULTISPECIES: capsule biosynthesis protein [Sinorhizobium]ASY55158.1 Capsular polysaccharide export system protein KpsS [Sinorhizobium sp. CCBAU 05631]AUX75147.1 capsule polysaccharide biosynthesis/export KpsS-like protein [Sinorhizobium fredii]PDT41999.1 capsular biosynthesis protein [Sinorhizobium sp. FG01]PDT53979.1 capsular biosynthesis protein [Sinorhizobium sp. NG07B]POH28809.1 capsular biosynthesis protein [Sinorhizobium americanum]
MTAGTTIQQQPRRTFLFLQGPSSPIFAKIATRLEAFGHTCLRINLNAGDQIFWRRGGAHNYRGSLADWGAYVESFLRRQSVSDLVLLGEERPYHRIAIAAARHVGIEVFVVEMGYLRPDWLTLERSGMSSNSHFPVDPEQIVQAAAGLPEPDWRRRHTQTFLAEAAYDLLYNLPNVFFWFLFPGYRRHAIFHPLAEYAGWVRRLAASKRHQQAADGLVASLTSACAPYFVYPLQLETDFQLRAHSPFNSQKEAIADILASFARHAPATNKLAVKVHPLDNSLIPWRRIIAHQAAALGVAERVIYLDGGNLDLLAEKSAGMVTVNSTAGLHALKQGKPVKVLGRAVFDIAGLTDQQTLDSFWTAPRPPDSELSTAMFRLMAASIQVRGNFYSDAGTDAGAKAIAERLHRNTVNQPGAFVDPPPRQRPEKRAAASDQATPARNRS